MLNRNLHISPHNFKREKRNPISFIELSPKGIITCKNTQSPALTAPAINFSATGPWPCPSEIAWILNIANNISIQNKFKDLVKFHVPPEIFTNVYLKYFCFFFIKVVIRLQRDSSPEPLSSKTNPQPFSQTTNYAVVGSSLVAVT